MSDDVKSVRQKLDRKHTVPRRPVVVRATVVVAALVTLCHVAASFLWIAPPTPLRELVPGNVLSSYMIPWFGQSWSVFAPEPINGDYRVKVRAILERDGVESVTDWVSATDVEQSMAQHNLFPPRAAGLAVRSAMKFKTAWDKLSDEQRALGRLNYFKGDAWLARMQADMTASGQKDSVVEYIVRERYMDAYATQVATTVWDKEDIVRVQYLVSRQNIVPFAQRNDPKAERPAEQYFVTGWRGLIELPGQSHEDFAAVFGPAYERVKHEKQ